MVKSEIPPVKLLVKNRVRKSKANHETCRGGHQPRDAGVKLGPPSPPSTEPAAPSPEPLPPPASQPHLSPFAAGSEGKRSLAGTAGCLGNTLCHSSGLEQELAYPCQSAGRIWAMPCVNRLSDFHSGGSGVSPTPPLWKSDPSQPLSESPQSPPLFSHFLS